MTDENTQAEMPAQDAIAPETEVAESSPAPVETQVDDTPPQGEPEEQKKPSWAQKRIDELTRNWREEQRRTDALTQALLANRVQIAPEEKPAAQPEKLPTLEEFGYDEARYQAALLDYADKRAQQTVEKRFAEYERQKTEQQRVETFATRQADFAKSTPDFEDKVLRDPTLPITAGMRDVIIDSPSGPELAYWLATNRAEAEKIARLPVHLAALEMGRIEGRIEAQKAAKAAAPAKPVPVVSKAPAPPPTLEAAETSGPSFKATDPESDKLSDAEWRALRDKELKRKAKR